MSFHRSPSAVEYVDTSIDIQQRLLRRSADEVNWQGEAAHRRASHSSGLRPSSPEIGTVTRIESNPVRRACRNHWILASAVPRGNQGLPPIICAAAGDECDRITPSQEPGCRCKRTYGPPRRPRPSPRTWARPRGPIPMSVGQAEPWRSLGSPRRHPVCCRGWFSRPEIGHSQSELREVEAE